MGSSGLPPEPPPRWVRRESNSLSEGGQDEDLITLMPLDASVEQARGQMREVPPALPRRVAEPVVTPPRLQFSVAQAMFFTTAIAIALAMVQVLAPQWIAGALGIAAFAMLFGVEVYQPARREPYVIAWAMILLYIVLAGVALLR